MKWRNLVNKLLGRNYGVSKAGADTYSNNTSSDLEVVDVVRESNFSINDLKSISEDNLRNAITFLDHRLRWTKRNLEEYEDSNVSGQDLQRVILNPNEAALIDFEYDIEEVSKAAEFSNEFVDRETKNIKAYVKDLEAKTAQEFKKSEDLKTQQDEIIKGKFNNVSFLNSIEDSGLFISQLKQAEVRCALLLTDSFFTRDTDFYKRITDLLDRNKISFVEFTNIQPELDRKLIFRISEFANDHDVNALIAIGSMSTVDIAQILMPKLMKPNIIRLHKTREFEPALAAKYSLFTIPTFVVPDPKVNSRSAIRNRLFLPKYDFFGNILYLKSEIDDAEGVFYCTDVFEILSRDKMQQVLHETFFRLIFCYFDLSSTDSLLDSIVNNIKTVEKLLDVFVFGKELSHEDKRILIHIISSTLDGRSIVDVVDFWAIHKLEGALSLLVNSKRSDGLALFMPAYIEALSIKSAEFNKRAKKLAADLYDAHSIEGLIYRLSLHIKKYGLPSSLLDVEQVKKVDYKFLTSLLQKAKIGSIFGILHKTIVKNVAIL
ncbi:iron-containing alcohol dehydrogenase [Candidatus Mycoplasma haematohominis]|uniref:Iron-containing alcohol dehydrogenase n=1 Tax=Candidatus Mycoplasma haematohominis TaxID=1494318 RepID=A0A478FRH2_9MOLU|nr:iron-containing alcohol dehydrogenase [Candidatus Mycoplasma haemohominis]GCE63777.1 iron-containing alcohol dehydrogenase [Candidatus Mycoplasma haemohominis]